jgi:hypothetical protein
MNGNINGRVPRSNKEKGYSEIKGLVQISSQMNPGVILRGIQENVLL